MSSQALANPLSQRGPAPTLGETFNLTLDRPRAPRWGAPFKIGDRTADFRRFFAFWIDIVEDVDISARRDPNAHIKMMRDPQIYACHTIRALATASLPWTIIPANDEPESKMYSAQVEKMLRAMPNWSQVVKNIMLAVPMGLSINEIVWNIGSQGTVYPYRAFPVHKDRFVFDLDGNLAIRSPVDVFWGERVPDWTFVPHVFDQVPGSFSSPLEEARLFFGFGLNDVLYPTWFAKQILMRMDLRYLERFANAIRVGRYPRRNEQGRQEIQRLFDDMMNEGMVLFPSDEGYDFKLEEASQGGHNSFQQILDYLDRQISKAYLGSTLLLDIGDVGSYSLGRVHERTTFGRIAEFDHHAVSSTVNTYIIPWIFELNSWPKRFMPRHTFTLKESHNINELIEALRIAQSMGYRISSEMVEEATGFRQARDDETILQVNPMDNGGQGSVTQISGTQDMLSPQGRQQAIQQSEVSPSDMRLLRGQLERVENLLLQKQVQTTRQLATAPS